MLFRSSLRLLPEALLKHPDSLVLFTYTSFDRTEFFTLDQSVPQVKSEGYMPVGINWTIVDSGEQHRYLNSLYLKECYNSTEKDNRYRIYNTILTVELLCKKFSKEIIYFCKNLLST